MDEPRARDGALCILPWTHVEVVPEGNAKVCCVAREAIRQDGRPMSVAECSLEEIRRSPYMRSVRSALADGRRIPVCGFCWEQEERGEHSQRELWNTTFPDSFEVLKRRLEGGMDPADPLPMEYLQISVGNKCNLACRMCNASYSSRIAEDPVHLKWVGRMQRAVGVWADAAGRARPGPDLPAEPVRRARWMPGVEWFEQPEFVEKDMMGAGSSLKMLYVTGGEPLFVPAFDRILDDFVARGVAHDMVLILNTNLFHNEARIARAMEKLLQFKRLHLGPSIDGHGAVYEYVRYPARWDVVERNLRRVARMAAERDNLLWELATVVQAYNVFNLVDLLRFSDELSVVCKPHVLDGPTFLRPHVLPEPLRLEAARILGAYAETSADSACRATNRENAARIAAHLRGIEDTPELAGERSAFIAFTRDLDASRGQSLERSVPELRGLMAQTP